MTEKEKNGKKWQNISMPFTAKIKHLQGAENLPYKECHPHPQNATQTKIELLRAYRNARREQATQRLPENTRGEPPKIASEPPNAPPHIYAPTQKEKAPQSKKRPARHKEKPPGKSRTAKIL